MTLPQADPQAVTAAYQEQTAALRTQLEAYVAALWLSLPDWRNGSMRDFAGQAVPVVNGAMGHMQALTTAYLAAMSELNGGSAAPVAVKTLDVAAVRGGVSAAQVYGRPFHLVWRMLGDGKPLDVAVKAGEARAVQLAATDAQLAKTHTAKAAMARNRKIGGYRRVLEGPASCALCIVASTRAYHKAELMPIHPACDCGTAPRFAGEEGDGIILDPALLEAAHATVSDTFGADSSAAQRIEGAFKGNGDPLLYRDILVTHAHGELGPILGIRGQSWTGPGDLAA